jgi:hypothetical protein
MSARTRKTAQAPATQASLKFSAINGIVLAIGFAAIVAGFSLLHHGSTTAAPLLLVLGYAVIVPIGIVV